MSSKLYVYAARGAVQHDADAHHEERAHQLAAGDYPKRKPLGDLLLESHQGTYITLQYASVSPLVLRVTLQGRSGLQPLPEYAAHTTEKELPGISGIGGKHAAW